ncbi:tetratricopeptide repeat protein [Azospirillum sp.]|uniref:tetratricopeptide repeat protein n=1 Tax=Azospirillum sp. TaxID=34012 RepID=UPI003D72E3F2
MSDTLPLSAGLESAFRLLRAGDWHAAIVACREALSRTGEHPAAILIAAMAAERLGRADVAHQLARQAADALETWSSRNAQAGRRDAALAALRWAVALSPEDAGLYERGGERLIGLGRITDSARMFRQALRLQPDLTLPASRLPDICAVLGQWGDCARTLPWAIRVDPTNPALYYLQCLTELSFGRPQAAERAIGRAIRLGGIRASYELQRGYALFDLGRVEEALEAFQSPLRDAQTRQAVLDNVTVGPRLLANAAKCTRLLGRPIADLPVNVAYAEQEVARARARLEAGDQQAASQHYAHAVASRPDRDDIAAALDALLWDWQESLKTPGIPIEKANPEWVVMECRRADARYWRLLNAEPSYAGVPSRVPAAAARKQRRVWDGFMFSNELDILELRLNVLDGAVDRFVIVESPWTHQGQPKELVFWNNRDRFAAFADRIVHVVASERRIGVPWEQESYQRTSIGDGLAAADDCDLLIIADVDEIPRPELVRRIAGDDFLAGRLNGLSVSSYNYFINFESYQPFVRPVILPIGMARKLGINLGRHLLLRSAHHIVPVIPEAGWHFSWIGGVDAVWRKLQNFCHLELLDRMPTREEVREKLENGDLQITAQQLEGHFVPVDSSFPKEIQANRQKYEALGWIWEKKSGRI